MAKNNPQPSARSKIRVFFVDADLAPGDMQELTNALTSAIRPTHVVSRVPASNRLAAGPNGSEVGTVTDDVEVEELDERDLAEDDEPSNVAKGPSKPRKYRSPKVVIDLDMSAGGKPFKQLAAEKGNPTEHVTRYLIAAYWLAEFSKLPTISVDHVYTCYKSAGWTLNVTDPSFAFRSLKKEGLGDTKNGKFTMNHLGRARVEEMKAEES